MHSKQKKCSQCGKKKQVEAFPFENKKLNQRRASCKKCKNTAAKRVYEVTRDDPPSVAKRIVKKCREREKERLSKFIKRRDNLDYLPNVELTDKDFDLDYQWVLAQRDKQHNRCYYTNREMVWSTGLIDGNRRMNPAAVTVERLDSNRPYVKDNCVLVTWRANCFKGDGLLEEMYEYAFDIMYKYLSENKVVLAEVAPILESFYKKRKKKWKLRLQS